ncbi:MAG: hypothetical protein LWW93_10790 [Hyphomicrobiales bacterium]|nr:hypothetical protein [Hyphomicrobiales bacterium]
MFRFYTVARTIVRRTFGPEALDRRMCASSTCTALRHYWIDPLDRR